MDWLDSITSGLSDSLSGLGDGLSGLGDTVSDNFNTFAKNKISDFFGNTEEQLKTDNKKVQQYQDIQQKQVTANNVGLNLGGISQTQLLLAGAGIGLFLMFRK